MKAAVIYENGGPDVLRYEDVPDPECPDGCVVIDVEAISIEGGDLLPAPARRRRRSRTSSATSPRARWPRSAPASRTARSATASSTLNMAGLARVEAGGPRDLDLADPRRARRRRRGVRPGRGRHRPGVPVHRRPPRGRADRPDPCRSRRRRDGRDPARQAGRRDRDLDRLQRREARAPEGVRPRPRDQLRHRELRRANPRADRRPRRRRDPRLGRRRDPGRQHRRARLPRHARQRRRRGPRRLRTSRRGSCGRRTTRCAASSSAAR